MGVRVVKAQPVRHRESLMQSCGLVERRSSVLNSILEYHESLEGEARQFIHLKICLLNRQRTIFRNSNMVDRHTANRTSWYDKNIYRRFLAL